MLSSAEHEILNAHKYRNIKKVIFFSGSDTPRMLFSLLINVKFQQLVALQEKNSCSAELNMNSFIT